MGAYIDLNIATSRVQKMTPPLFLSSCLHHLPPSFVNPPPHTASSVGHVQVPDTIDRGSLKATGTAKMLAVTHSGLLKKEMPAVVCFLQANSASDLNPAEVLQKVSKFERELVDTSAGICL